MLKKHENLNILFYALPLIVVFTIVLLAHYPGILVSDSMVQWHQAQTGIYTDWHPAYTSLLIGLLCKIWNNPAFVLEIQLIIFSLIWGYSLSVIKKHYKINNKVLIIASILFALFPLNFNFAITLLKDILYSAFILLLTVSIIDLVHDKDFFTKIHKVIIMFLACLFIMLFRHNGIYVILALSLILIIVYRKKLMIYLIMLGSISCYLLLTTVGFEVLDVEKGNVANKYGPVSHVVARILNEDSITLTNKEKDELSKYVDVTKLKESYDPYNMDYSINSQNIEYIKGHGSDYLKFGLSLFKKYPWQLFKHYIYLDSYLYSPIPFKGSYVIGMFTQNDLYLYEDIYPQLNENSKLPHLLPIIRNSENFIQSHGLGVVFLRPAIYMYFTIITFIIMSIKSKKYKYLLIMCPMLLNTLFLAVALPIAMVRYAYPTLLVFDLTFIIAVNQLIKKHNIIKLDNKF